ncbi:N-acetylglucosamine kinase [Pectobacterium parvum]|uniref:N-acetyl-D-glucosamine kinase n=1 Tax=Pectobacterium parvum TaxID=2778550 RepID=A0AAP9LEU5_9GAMM|nr:MULTISPECIES: N-acetylglucosamine kinase [Pectobacterium]GKW41087.1 N-acetyl-D-glucosamine kinase [Pectobacterium carotovorum subsp. carotovorum]KFX18654.1 N-acetylglucosamine kinase [Pectobacterium parvum]KHS99217.1 N-acetylglucosamine kinase [Pectobacterium parvum]MCU1800052.1 N-acetylglucosamine kinase [Pectobacterium parvum]QHQ26114.1 N-acetylglucosamine kinase [Pectobacterium parvum]
MYYGFDMGGTKIELGVFDAELNKVWQKRVPTPRNNYDDLLLTLVNLVHEADAQVGMQGKVGLGVPGMETGNDGALFTANLPATMRKPLRTDLSQRLQRDIRISNDANCFVLSEAWDAEFRSYPIVLGMILGTGLGGGLVINGRPVDGRNGIAGEFGHLRLPSDALDIIGVDIPRVKCGCGQSGCIENYISGRGFEWLYEHLYGEALPAVTIIRHYRGGEEKAQEFVDRFMDLLAACLGNLLTLFDPHLLVLGGGLSNFDEIYQILPTRLPSRLLPIAKLPRIEKARHGDAGGVRGAALLHLMDN